MRHHALRQAGDAAADVVQGRFIDSLVEYYDRSPWKRWSGETATAYETEARRAKTVLEADKRAQASRKRMRAQHSSAIREIEAAYERDLQKVKDSYDADLKRIKTETDELHKNDPPKQFPPLSGASPS